MTMFRKVAPEEVNRKLLHGLVVILPLGIFYAPTLFELDRTAMAALVLYCYLYPYLLKFLDSEMFTLGNGSILPLARCFGLKNETT